MRIVWPRENRNGNRREDFMPISPRWHLGKIVRADEPNKVPVGEPTLQTRDCVGGISGAKLGLQITHPYARMVGAFLR